MRRFLHIASVQYMSIKSKISNGLLKREVTSGRESCSNIFLRKISRRLLDCHYPKKLQAFLIILQPLRLQSEKAYYLMLYWEFLEVFCIHQ